MVESVWFHDVANGMILPIAPSYPRIFDPSDYFNVWYGKDGPQNYSSWNNRAFQDVADQIDHELNRLSPWL